MNNKFLGAFVFTAVLLTGLIAGIFLIKQRQEFREKAQVASDILVSLSPGTETTTKNQKITISVVLTNRTNPARDVSIFTAGVDLSFDTASFTPSTPSCNSSFLSSPAVAGISGNKISLSCFAPGGSGSRTIAAGTQTVLGTVDLTALDKTGTSDIQITRANVPDAVTSQDLSGGTGLGGSYTISAVGGIDQTPSPSASGTPAGTSSSNPTQTPSPTSSPTPKPTPKPTVKATKTPISTFFATATPEVLLPLESPTPLVFQTFPPQPQGAGQNIVKYVIAGISFLLLLVIFIWIIKKMFGKGNPPPTGPTPPPAPPINMVPPVVPPTSAPPNSSSV